jgi:rod shape determining protein RodA
MQNAKLLSTLYNQNLIKQILWYLIGLLSIFIINKINTKTIFKYAKFLYFASCILLIMVLLLGKETNGAKAWFNIGIVSFQPSELMKLSLLLFLADFVANYKIISLKSEFFLILKVLVFTIIPSVLVFLEPDTGAIIFYFIIAITVLYLKKIKKFWFITFFSSITVFLILFIFFYLYNQDLLINIFGTSLFYRVERIISFTNESSYQLSQSLIAIGSATSFGTGLNNVAIYIPEAPTDFIFAFSISNFGYFTGFIILNCYFIIDIYLIKLTTKVKTKKIKLFLSSFINIFLIQQFINIGMNIGLLPIIGIPLPFLSYGGSNLIIYFIFLGLILNFTNNNRVYNNYMMN